MRKPSVSKPRPPRTSISLSRKLPPLSLSATASPASPRPRPQVGRPGRASLASLSSQNVSLPPTQARPNPDEATCNRCYHGESLHPVRYVCDKYPHADPLQICGCESETLDEICHLCGHKARWHKARHRCRSGGCHCWGFEGV